MNRLIAMLVFLFPAMAFAHPGHGGGLVQGFLHPVGGLDHVLTALAVGFLAVAVSAPRRLPALFLAAAAVGYCVGAPLSLPTDPAIAVLLALLGGALVLGGKAGVGPASILVSAAGLLHGAAHGAEVAAGSDATLFATGFLAATAALHVAGIAAAQIASQFGARRAVLLARISGALTAAAATLILFGVL